MRIVVADDNLLIREGVRALLEGAPGVELVGICHDRDSLLASIEADRPDVVLTDVRMPPSRRDEGIVIANELRHAHPEMGVIVLSQYETPGYVVHCSREDLPEGAIS
jgi:DNA-binding NarL/FixJ family response regulator